MDTQLNNGVPAQDFVSLLADGRLQGAEFATAVDAVAGDAEARATWHAYHVVGEVLRNDMAPTGSDAAFLARFRDRLAAEPAVPRLPVDVVTVSQGVQAASPRVMAPAANESVFRWKLVAGLASVVAVSALAWSTISGLGLQGAAQQLAQAPQVDATKVQTVAAVTPPVMIRDARLDELPAAHKQSAGGGSALHMSSGFLRNATIEGAAR